MKNFKNLLAISLIVVGWFLEIYFYFWRFHNDGNQRGLTTVPLRFAVLVPGIPREAVARSRAGRGDGATE